ncbi:hypothetical protein [Leucobacter sp. Ag1]|uniref:hypothetical protein n=1 Tax=Leucobacter sp. Ag1 TaxID=1642040 RepID=UPI000AD1FB9F|nr:hypothetical protein [Leucobacter sp. Ag1]
MPSSSFKRPLPQVCIALSTLAVSGIAALTLPFGTPALAEDGAPAPHAEAPQTTPATAPGPGDATPQTEAEPAEEELPEEEVIGHLTVTPMQAYPGEKVRVTGQCKIWGHGPTDVWLSLDNSAGTYDGPSFSTVAFDEATGEFDTEVTLSKAAPPGKYRMPWMCSVDDQIFAGSDVAQTFTVLGTTTPPTKQPPTSPAPPLDDRDGGGLMIDPGTPKNTSAPTELAETGNGEDPWVLSLAAGALALGGAGFVMYSRRLGRAKHREGAA